MPPVRAELAGAPTNRRTAKAANTPQQFDPWVHLSRSTRSATGRFGWIAQFRRSITAWPPLGQSRRSWVRTSFRHPQDLRRPHRRRRDARPAPPPLRRIQHRRRQLPNARPPRPSRQTPKGGQHDQHVVSATLRPADHLGNFDDRHWGQSAIGGSGRGCGAFAVRSATRSVILAHVPRRAGLVRGGSSGPE
jgi:hypothetical protein